jgi:hypothetical protein
MPEPRADRETEREPRRQPHREPASRRADPHAEAVNYPEDHIVAILDSPEAAVAAAEALTTGGFLESEVTLACGVEAADRLKASSGRPGLIGQLLQIADSLGIRTEELEIRHEYEEALRRGRVTLLVFVPTEERKERAAEILRKHGAHFINFMGQLTIEQLAP